VKTAWFVPNAQNANTHTAKTRESVAKSQKSVNEKNALLAWRNAYTCPLRTKQMEG